MTSKGLAARAPKELSLAELGARVEALRIDLDMTRPQLAVACGVDPSTIYRLEKGNHSPAFDKLGLIAKALGTTVVDLVKP